MANIKESAIRLVLKAKDLLSKDVKKSADSLDVLKAEAKELKDKLSTLENQSALLTAFQKQTKAVRNAGNAFREAEAKVDRLAKEYKQASKPTRELKEAVTSAKKSVAEASRAYQRQEKDLERLSSQLAKTKKPTQTLIQAVSAAKKAVKESNREYQRQQKTLDQLTRNYNKAQKNTLSLSSSLLTARTAVTRASKAYQDQREKLDELRQSLKQAGLSTKNLAGQQKNITAAISNTAAAYQKATAKVKETARAMRSAGLSGVARNANKASDGINRLTGRLAGLVTATAAFIGLKKSMQGVLETGDQFDRLQIQLNAIMGSASEGERAVEWIKQFTRDTPLQIAQVTEAFTMLKNFGLDPMDGSLQAIVDTNSMLGGDFEKLRRISLALGQAWGKQKLQAEELRQLIEAGVPVWEILAKVTGENVTVLRKLTEQGKLGTDVIKKLMEEMGNRAIGAAADNMELYSGLLSNLIDRWTLFKKAIADAGWSTYVRQLMKDFSEQWDKMVEDGRLAKFAKTISDGFISMAESVRASLSSITFDEFITGVQSALINISNTLGAMRSAFEFSSNTAKLFFNTFTGAVKGFAAGILNVLATITYGWQKIFEVTGLETLEKKFAATTNLMRDQAAAFTKEVVEDAKDAKDALVGMYESFATQHKKAQVNVRKESKLTWDMVREERNRYKVETEDAADTMVAAFKDVKDAIEQVNDAESRVELASLGVTIAEAFSQGTLSLEEYTEAMDASREKLKSFKEEAEDTKDAVKNVGDSAEQAGAQQAEALTDASTIAGVMAGHYNTLTAELQGMSGAAHDAFVAMNGVGNVNTEQAISGIAELKSQLE
ncbi:tape measure protein [Endozoicomonas atrinae]|uniref:tape measure protein n=1 Tax=Endozoicomonas atrinae TaxID=1333660 RepID=UPI003B00F674